MKLASLLFYSAVAVAAGSTPVRGDGGLSPILEESVRVNLQQASNCVANGSDRRAQAYASLAALPENLTYRFDNSLVDSERASELNQWATEGFDAWNDTYLLNFSEAADASVVVVFKNSIWRSGRHAGYLTNHRLARYGAAGVEVQISATIDVSNRMPDGRLMNREQIRKVVMHEVGHLLGLADSRDSNATMGPITRNPGVPSVDDEAVQALAAMHAEARSYIAPVVVQSTTTSNGYVPRVFTFAEPR